MSELIEAFYGVRLTVRNMGKYLKRWRFTPQRLLKKAYEQSHAAGAKWVSEEYPKIAAQAKQEGAEISGATRQACVRTTCALAAMRRRERLPWCWPMPIGPS